nr:hypothetical protein [Microctonus hyperodae filamentous virus]
MHSDDDRIKIDIIFLNLFALFLKFYFHHNRHYTNRVIILQHYYRDSIHLN